VNRYVAAAGKEQRQPQPRSLVESRAGLPVEVSCGQKLPVGNGAVRRRAARGVRGASLEEGVGRVKQWLVRCVICQTF
jgi:hypothetical protein